MKKGDVQSLWFMDRREEIFEVSLGRRVMFEVYLSGIRAESVQRYVIFEVPLGKIVISLYEMGDLWSFIGQNWSVHGLRGGEMR